MQVYQAAQRAVTEQIARWQEETRRQLEGAEAGIEAGVRAAGVLDEHVAIVSQIKIWASRSGIEASAGLMVNESNRLKPQVQKTL